MKKILAAKKLTFAIAFSGTVMVMPARAGIPVIDGGNLVQNLVTALEEVAQTAKQIEQYKTQLEQYENQIKNTVAPAAYIWDEAQKTINALNDATNTLNYYKNQLGSLDSYISKFQDVNYYRSSPCFTATGCSETERAALENSLTLASESQKKANDALFKGLDQQQSLIQSDASTLKRLQSNAQSAQGQMEALGYANQLASAQANQLLQIRSLLIAQQNAIATKMSADANLGAIQQAAHEAATASRIEKTPNPKNWLVDWNR